MKTTPVNPNARPRPIPGGLDEDKRKALELQKLAEHETGRPKEELIEAARRKASRS